MESLYLSIYLSHHALACAGGKRLNVYSKMKENQTPQRLISMTQSSLKERFQIEIP